MVQVLLRDHSLLQKEKEKVRLELEIALRTVSPLSKLEAENENLRKITEQSAQRESTLVSRIEELKRQSIYRIGLHPL